MRRRSGRVAQMQGKSRVSVTVELGELYDPEHMGRGAVDATAGCHQLVWLAVRP